MDLNDRSLLMRTPVLLLVFSLLATGCSADTEGGTAQEATGGQTSTVAAVCGNISPGARFFLSPGHAASGDLEWQAHVSGFTEFGFEDIRPGTSVDSLTAGPITVDLGLEGLNGTESLVGTFRSGAFSVPGVFFGNSLLNEWHQRHSRVSFTFSEPVEGFGTWVFDDTMATQQSFRMIVTDASGAVSVSPVLESGNGSGHAIEGFIGVTSPVGITKVSIENLEEREQCRTPTVSYFELDHVQIGNRHTSTNLSGDEACSPNGSAPAVPDAGQQDTGHDGLNDVCDTCPGSVDLMTSEVTSSCGSEGLTLSARVTNRGLGTSSAGLKVAFYQGNPASGGALLGVATLPDSLAASASAVASIVLPPAPGGTATVFAVADDDGTGRGRELECREDNNAASAAVSLACADDGCIELRLGGYNLFLLEDYSGGHDVQGKAAAGGNVSMTDFTVGAGLADSDITHSLVAGGNLTLSRGGVWGDAWYGGSYTTDPSVVFPRGGASQGAPIDFATRGTELRTLSRDLAALPANGTAAIEPWGGVMLRGTDPAVNIFQVNASDLSSAVLLSIDAPAGSLAVLNISGVTATLQGGHSFSGGIDQRGVLFNFVNATAINASAYGLWGTMLAPYAHVSFSNGSFDGGIYARSMTGNAEGHINPLQDRDICPGPSFTPGF